MFNAPKASTTWIPYIIPPMPNDLWESGKQYVLGLSNEKPLGEEKSPSEKNPSPFFIWTEGGGSTPPHPWKITIRIVPESDPPQYEYSIESSSKLFNGFGGNEINVTGADGIFRILQSDGYVFIELTFSNEQITQSQIKINEQIGDLVEFSFGTPPKQTKLRQQIGYVSFNDEGVPQIVLQNAWHNYTLFDICRNGVPAKVTIAT